MNKLIFCFSILTLTFGFSSDLNSQASLITITGKVVEQGTDQPVEFATVVLADKTSNQTITGTITDFEGNFTLTSESSDVSVAVSFMGYATQTITNLPIENNLVNLGNIFIAEESATLSEVMVVAERSHTEFKLDRRVFNVGQDVARQESAPMNAAATHLPSGFENRLGIHAENPDLFMFQVRSNKAAIDQMKNAIDYPSEL